MSNPIIKIVNCETGEVVEREMNAAEYKKYEAEQEIQAIRKADAQAKAAEKAAILDRLGITADEAKLLLS
uniref:hypothetical protein n=1 Tax=Yoonia sp. TaxID=2212373 RepID=UPI0040473728